MDGWMDGNRASVCTSTVVLCSYETNCSLVTMTMPSREGGSIVVCYCLVAVALWLLVVVAFSCRRIIDASSSSSCWSASTAAIPYVDILPGVGGRSIFISFGAFKLKSNGTRNS